MLDLHSNYTAPAAWQAGLGPGNVVLFRFPYAEPDAAEPPKSRTCLVLEVERRSDGIYVELAYGTSADTDAIALSAASVPPGPNDWMRRPPAVGAAALARSIGVARRPIVRA
jgi:hypothetical protein